MEILVYIANILYLLSYFVQDMLRLRVLTIFAAMCLVGFFYFQPEPMLTVVCWNVFFIALNIFQLGRILATRRKGFDPVTRLVVIVKKKAADLVHSAKKLCLQNVLCAD